MFIDRVDSSQYVDEMMYKNIELYASLVKIIQRSNSTCLCCLICSLVPLDIVGA